VRCAGLVGGEAFRALASLLLRLRVLLDLGELELGGVDLDVGHGGAVQVNYRVLKLYN
jgi:hypothetical protein